MLPAHKLESGNESTCLGDTGRLGVLAGVRESLKEIEKGQAKL